jgi:hypothetical protein
VLTAKNGCAAIAGFPRNSPPVLHKIARALHRQGGDERDFIVCRAPGSRRSVISGGDPPQRAAGFWPGDEPTILTRNGV